MRNKTQLTLTLLSKPSILATAVLMSLTACSGSKWHETRGVPNTGDAFAERQIAQPTAPLRVGDTGYISTDKMPARSKVDEPVEDVSDSLERNDQIKIVDEAPQGDDGSVEAVVVSTAVPELRGKKVFIPKQYVSNVPVNDNDADKYFVIQNIATEKLRVYRNCETRDKGGECVHKMVFETDMAAGRNTPSGRSLLGSFRITQWFKFYEDRDHAYPSFMAENYPKLPDVGSNLDAWLSKTLLPNSKGVTRGSFGWYTAYLGPNANEQWTHGTIGWAKDGGKFIDAAKDPSNTGKFERSLGCTRVENQVIALMREMLPVGTKVFKVYAKEGYADPARVRYQSAAPAKWSWILTNDGAGSTTAKSGAKSLGPVNDASVMERGFYTLDQMPDAVALNAKANSRNEENGNTYNIDPSSMKGVLLVDEGRLAGYSHPTSLKVGGQFDHKLPSLVISDRTDVSAVRARVAGATNGSFD